MSLPPIIVVSVKDTNSGNAPPGPTFRLKVFPRLAVYVDFPGVHAELRNFRTYIYVPLPSVVVFSISYRIRVIPRPIVIPHA